MKRIAALLLLVISIFAVKLGFPGEEVYIRGDKTGIGVDTTDSPEAFLDIRANDDGILIPRLTILERDGISSPPTGLTIYNSDCNLFNYYDGTAWIPFPNLMGMEVGPISGSTSICEGASGVAYAIPDVDEAISYTWTLPDDATIATGSGTRSITVDFGSDEGRICVIAHTPCGSQGDCISVTVAEAAVGGNVTGGGTISLGESTPTLTLSGYTGTIARWQRRYEGGSWIDISHTGITYTETPSMVGNWDYRAVITSAGCPDAFSDFASVTVEGSVTGDSTVFTYTGTIQSWTVPTGVTSIEIEVWGAQGGTGGGTSYPFGSPGGLGARMRGTFSVTPGEVLKVLVGEQGVDISHYTAGGGGGSFVWKDGETDPMIIAGGGGGGGGRGAYNYEGIDAVTTIDGTDGNNAPGGAGTGGNGGVLPSDGSGGYGGGGCGWYSNGANGHYSSYTEAGGGTRPLEGGAGGAPGASVDYNTRGGFGGGGGAQGAPNTAGGGGGGGYSGGGGGERRSLDGGYQYSGGGGGGSYNSGTAQSNSAGVRSGNGRVVIRM